MAPNIKKCATSERAKQVTGQNVLIRTTMMNILVVIFFFFQLAVGGGVRINQLAITISVATTRLTFTLTLTFLLNYIDKMVSLSDLYLVYKICVQI